MDNILKLLLGVLGVAGLIAFATSTLSVDAQVSETAAPPPVIEAGPPPVIEGIEEVGLEEESPEEDGEDVLAMGEPMIDGNPYGSNGQQVPQYNPQAAYDPTQAGNFNYAQPVMPAYGLQQINPAQPPPGTYAPVDNGQ